MKPCARALGAALFAVAAVLEAGAARAQTNEPLILGEEDWPCHGKYRLEFSAGAVWPGPPLGPATAAWRDDPAVRRLAEELAAPETMREPARAKVAAFAAGLSGDPARARRLALLFRGVVDELNLYRRFVLEGIVGSVARRRLAAGALARTEVELAGLPDDGSAQAAQRRKAIEERRFWQARAVDRAEGEAQFLCKRLTALEGKLGALARAIAGQLPP